MSGGIDSSQTSKGQDNLALWAKAYATVFPCLPIWEKEHSEKSYGKTKCLLICAPLGVKQPPK